MTIRAAIIAAALTVAAHADAETQTCSTSFQGYTGCQGPDGYRSTEWKWQDRTIGQNSDGGRWSTSRWRDGEIITVAPGPDR